MKKHFITGLLATFAIAASAQSFTEWQNPEVNAVNRAPMHTNYFAYESEGVAQTGVKEHSSRFMTLNGTWKFFWVKDAEEEEDADEPETFEETMDAASESEE